MDDTDLTAGWTLEQWRAQARFQAELVAALNREAMALRDERVSLRLALGVNPDTP